jgi:subtilase family serine protease
MPALAQSRLRDRIVEPADNEHFSAVRGHLRAGLTADTDLGALPADTKLGGVTMFFQRTPQQDADLQTLLAQQQDSSSANFHRWLTPEEFADRFGLTQGDVDKIVAWLQSQGLTMLQVSRSRSWVTFSGSVQQVQAALRTELHRYPVGGEMHFAASREPSVPSAFAGVVMGFRGLDDFRMKPQEVKTVDPRLTSGIPPGNHFLTPGDLAAIYNLSPLYSAGIDGTNQKVVVVGQTAINITDVQKFRSLSGLPANDPQIVLVPGATDPGMVPGDVDEANLDLDWIGAVARKAVIKYVYANSSTNTSGVITALVYAIDSNLAPVISISYGNCEGGTAGFTSSSATSLASLLQQGNAQGITIVAPAGDNGAADCDNGVPVQQGLSIDLPGGTPYATSVGGTRFTGDASDPPVPSGFWLSTAYDPTNSAQTASTATSYIPETSWNDTLSKLAATGGGSSIFFPKPSWQTGTGVPVDGARDVPDVSFNASGAHDPYIACSEDNISSTSTPSFEPSCENGFRRVRPGNANLDQTFAAFGGTSAGVPIFAGMVALINQQTNSAGQGNVNPKLYAMAASPANAFHDVTTGNNTVPYQATNTLLPECPQTGSTALGYLATSGYDLVTGLGSINAANLVNNWSGVNAPAAGSNLTANFSLAINPTSVTVKRGACGSVAVALTRNSGFAGTPVFTCTVAAPLSAAKCVVSPVASAAAPLKLDPPSQPWWLITLLVLGSCFVTLLLLVRNQRDRIPQKGRLAWAPGFAATCLLAFMIGCGGGGSSNSSSNGSNGTGGNTTPPTSNYAFTLDAPASTTVGSAAVTVTGTIGGVSHTAQVTLTVN